MQMQTPIFYIIEKPKTIRFKSLDFHTYILASWNTWSKSKWVFLYVNYMLFSNF